MSNMNTFKIILLQKKINIYEKMGPTHSNQNGPGFPEKVESIKITSLGHTLTLWSPWASFWTGPSTGPSFPVFLGWDES